MLCYNGAQMLVQMENKISQPCISSNLQLTLCMLVRDGGTTRLAKVRQQLRDATPKIGMMQ